MGYSNQVERCTSLSSCPIEKEYKKDVDLLQNTIGTIKAKSNLDDPVIYFTSSRDKSSDSYGHVWYGFFKVINDSFGGSDLCDIPVGGGLLNSKRSAMIRPILTLKSDVEIADGDGKSANTAFQLN